MSTQIAASPKKEEAGIQTSVSRKASEILAGHLCMDPGKMIDAIKAQCFSGIDASKVTNEALAAFCVVANNVGLNPLIPGMMYAFLSKTGAVVPIIGPDGVMKLIEQHPDILGYTTEHETDKDGNLFACVVTIYRKGGKMSAHKRCYLSEWKIETNPNWKTRPIHMLEIRTLKHCARQIIHGIPMDEEEMQIIDAQVVKPAATQQLPGETKSSATARAIAQRQAPPEIVVPPAYEPASTNSGTEPDGEPVGNLFEQ